MRVLPLTIVFGAITVTCQTDNDYWTSYFGFDSGGSILTGSRDVAEIYGPQDAYFQESTDTIYYINQMRNRIMKVSALTGIASEVAGTGANDYLDGPFSTSKFRNNYGLTMDGDGNLYVSDYDFHTIRKLFFANSTVTTFAGSQNSAGDMNGLGTNAKFNSPRGITCDNANNIYVADLNNHKIRKITPQGQVTTLAGNGGKGYIDGSALNAVFNLPTGVAVDKVSLDVYVCDQGNHVIRKISQITGLVSTFAGSFEGYLDGEARIARFRTPEGVDIDKDGNLYVSDMGNLLVRKISSSGVVTTIAGRPGYSGTTVIAGNVGVGNSENGPGLESSFRSMRAMHVSSNGTAIFPDWSAGRLRIAYPTKDKSPTGKYFWQRDDYNCYTGLCVQTIAGNSLNLGRNGPPLQSSVHVPQGIFYHESTGDLYFTENYAPAIKMRLGDGSLVTRLAGGSTGTTDGEPYNAMFKGPFGIALNGNNRILVADTNNHVIRRIDMKTGTVITFAGLAGSSGTTDATGSAARFNTPRHIAIDSNNLIYVADENNNKIRVIDTNQVVTTLAGSGTRSYLDSAYLTADFNAPYAVAVNSDGSLIYVSDYGNNRIRKLSGGQVTTWAGSSYGYADGQGVAAQFRNPKGIALDSFGNLFVSDHGSKRIRKINSTAYVSSIAGRGSYGGQVGPANIAEFANPGGIDCKSDGSVVYVADADSRRVKIICQSICVNNGIMDCITGVCTCPPGWKGSTCSVAATGTQITLVI